MHNIQYLLVDLKMHAYCYFNQARNLFNNFFNQNLIDYKLEI